MTKIKVHDLIVVLLRNKEKILDIINNDSLIEPVSSQELRGHFSRRKIRTIKELEDIKFSNVEKVENICRIEADVIYSYSEDNKLFRDGKIFTEPNGNKDHEEVPTDIAKCVFRLQYFERENGAVTILDMLSLNGKMMEQHLETGFTSLEAATDFLLDRMETFRLDEKGKKTVKEFFTFKYKAMHTTDSTSPINDTYYNLVICTEDKKRAAEFWDIMEQFLGHDEIIYISEKEALGKRDLSIQNTYVKGVLDGARTRDILFIHECDYKPFVDEETGTGSAIEKQKDNVVRYQSFWDALIKHAKETPGCTSVVVLSEAVYQDSFATDSEKNHRVWGHRVFIHPETSEEIGHKVIERLKQYPVALAETFESELMQYVNTIYRTADLKGVEFVNDLINRIYSLYYRKADESGLIDSECIPDYSSEIQSADTVIAAMDSMIGLENVKEELRRIYSASLVDGGRNKEKMYHMLFTGNPGTGKTRVAGLLSQILFQIGICTKSRPVVVKATELISKWSGGVTGAKATSVIKSAYGGVLFIDEAYALLQHAEQGQQVIDLLVKEMDEKRDKLIVVLAGYGKDMEKLLETNIGLPSRLTTLHFEDYTPEELNKIFELKCKEAGFEMDAACKELRDEYFAAQRAQEFFANGREAETLVNKLKEVWSREYAELAMAAGGGEVQLPKRFTEKHFLQILPEKGDIGIESMIGLSTVKQQIADFKTQVMYHKFLKEKGVKVPAKSMHMLFYGNPGTGKTTIAKMMANDLYSVGVLKRKSCMCVTKSDLVSPVPGASDKLTKDAVAKAAGGILFIDEAYSLCQGGGEAIQTLLTEMEDHKEDTIFIFAGYTDEMNEFLAINPGMKSRIGFYFTFEDYSVDELVQIYKQKLTDAGFIVDQAALSKAAGIMEYFSDSDHFGNGRFVENIVAMTIENRAKRKYSKSYNDIKEKDVPDHKMVIETSADRDYMYDPESITREAKCRTAIHELGHAVVAYVQDPEDVLESISINCRSQSFGRVQPAKRPRFTHTERELRDRIAVLLGGRNAERVFFGYNGTGCSNDYQRAKNIAQDMVNVFAMGEIGITQPMDFLIEADHKATDIITRYRDVIEQMCDILLEGKVIDGKTFKKLMDEKTKKRKPAKKQ